MNRIMSGDPYAFASTSASASASSASHTPDSDRRDELDFLGQDGDEVSARRGAYGHGDDGHDILEDDPLQGNLAAPMSFKRRQGPSFLSAPARLFSAIMGSRSNASHSSSRGPSPAVFSGSETPPRAEPVTLNAASKDGAPLDWYIEGPGRRVGYEDLTAIDWIFEYTKERQRLRVLYSSATGVLGYARRLIDASQVWIVLLLTGMAVGAVAACINVTTDWLGDLKEGYCSSGPEGGHFYLNKAFCCYGYDQGSKCEGWKTWGGALGVGSAGGRWFLEYFFFVGLAVRLDPAQLHSLMLMMVQDAVCICSCSSCARVCHLRQA
jgi:chloride channel 3/4/5